MTIRRRITVAAAAAVAVTMLLVIAASYVVVRSQLLIPIDESLVSRAAALARLPGVGQGGGEGFGRPGEGFLRPGAGDFDATYYLSLIHISEPTRRATISRMPSSA